MNILVLLSLGFALWFLYQTNHKLGGIMATLTELQSLMDSVASGVDALEAAIADLKTQVGNGGVVTQEDLDALHARAQAIVDDIAETSDQG